MIRITDGDLLHVYGSQGMGGDYSVRLEVQMKDVVDGETLQKAVENMHRCSWAESVTLPIWSAMSESGSMLRLNLTSLNSGPMCQRQILS